MNYVPLYVRSGYSFLSSGLKIEDICRIAQEKDCEYVSCSDFDNMYAYPILDSLAKKKNLKPLFGIEIPLIIEEHVININLYIENESGYRNLCKFITLVHNLDNLKKYSKGLTLIIPTLSNQYLCNLITTNHQEFVRTIFSITSLFTNSYIGIEYYRKEDKKIVESFRSFCSNHNYSKVCFAKHLYENKQDAVILNMLQAIKDEQKITFKDKIEGPYFYLSDRAIKTLYTQDEIKNTFEIARRIDFNFKIKRGELLNFSTNSNLSMDKYLEFCCLQNAKKRNIILDDKYYQRLNYEISIINKMGFCSYFLIVQDYVNFAKNNNIPVGPGRGSAAGSLVSYLLGITEIDPLKYNLMFERFLNPERSTMPDIDIDIADYARQNVIDYLYKKYDDNRVCNIITFQNIGAKQSIRDIGRIYSINNGDINTLCSLIKHPNYSIEEMIKTNNEFASLANDSYFKKIIEASKKIEGFPRQESLHAAGIIINNKDLTEIIPTKRTNDGHLVCQFEATYLESLGFLKMDILGLRNLSIINMCCQEIKKKHNNFKIMNINLSDQKTFDLLNASLTQGIFQLEGEGITNALKKIHLDTFDDLVALLALYRPGPMDNINTYSERKNNHQDIIYPHPLLEEILKPTYGVIIYQEQIMEIAQKISLFSLAEADIFRRAISKKDVDQLDTLKKQFIEGANKNQIDLNLANYIFELIHKFANYGFNKSHSVSYALISYQMAYIKANYPEIFYSVSLSFGSSSSDCYNKFKNELNIFQIKLKLPSINFSKSLFTFKNDQIILPLTSIKGLPTNLIDSIIYERETNGKFKSYEDVITRLYPYGLTQSHFLNLINSGCLDELNYNRQTMRKSIATLIQYSKTTSEINLLSDDEIERFRPIIKEVNDDIELNLEEEYKTIGIILSKSLFDKYSNFIKQKQIKDIFTISSSRASVSIGIIVTKIKEIVTKTNKKMAIMTGFDPTQEINITIFSSEYEKYQNLLKINSALLVKGYFKNSEQYGLSFICEQIEKMEENK